MTVIPTALLMLLACTGDQPAPAAPGVNRWAEPTRGILAQRCGSCHMPNLPTSVPRALAIFNLTDDLWYGHLEHDQFDALVLRLGSIRELPAADRATVDRFVLCARDGVCPTTGP